MKITGPLQKFYGTRDILLISGTATEARPFSAGVTAKDITGASGYVGFPWPVGEPSP